MQLSTIKSTLEHKSPSVIYTKGGQSETEQNHYFTFGDYTSCVLENLKTGICRIVDDHAYVGSMLGLSNPA